MNRYSTDDILASYQQKRNWEKQYPINYYLVRPLSFIVTYYILRLTTSPDKVAWLGFIIGILGCFSFLGISLWSVWPGIVLIWIFSVLDAVDGNIARTVKDITYYGKFLDSLIGEIISSVYCLLLGGGLFIYLQHENTYVSNDYIWNIFPLLLGVFICFGRLMSSFIDLKYEYHYYEKKVEEEHLRRKRTDEIQTSRFVNNFPYRLFINLNLLNNQLVFLMICAVFHRVIIFLSILALYYIVRMLTYLIYFTYQAFRTLK